MSAENRQLPPCAGEYEDDGCGVFNTYVENQLFCIANDEEDERRGLLQFPLYLRYQLYRDFIEAGHCVLIKEQDDQDSREAYPPGVVPILRPSEIAFSGCQYAIKLREDSDGSRLLNNEDLDRLIELPRPSGRLTNNDVSRSYTESEAAFQKRASEYRDVLVDEDAEIASRVEAAGVLLFYFYDLESLDTANKLFFDRLIQANQDRRTILGISIQEWDAWHKLVVGLDYFEALTPHIAERFVDALLVNGFDSGIDAVKRAAQQSYLHFNINLLANEVSKRSGTQAAHMSESVKSASFLLLDLIAEKTDHELSTTELIREFTSTGTCSDQSAEQTRLRLV